ncbi:Golgi phosphoprotein 3 GPP34 [Murinocardiopsis flavida]|uniref:Golgi phosphoprotein 3 GPP34 n=1 Tax=Murinocardiopsis flavida TaxID=645275 RepID=A0A2P8DRZ9_9ACTN|nr:GPP34 family phosphoprotein [Murinocardiopsis flavida]PSK99992.1 Golgi phosphoprotein 3 GPP34 [Murinocardiopsis flavida]
MDLTLPQRLYLLNFDLAKNKVDSNTALVRGQLMRAAAIAELTIAGVLTDQGGKAARDPGASPPGDPFLAEVFEDASPDKARSWFKLVDRNWHKAEATVRDQLEAAGAVGVVRRRALGIFPTATPSLRDPGEVRGLREAVRSAALLGRDPATLPIDEVVLAVLAVDGDVCCTVGRKERREHKPQLTVLREYFDTVLPRQRKAAGLSMTARRTAAA